MAVQSSSIVMSSAAGSPRGTTGAEHPPLVRQVVEAVALHLQLLQRRRLLEAPPAALAGAHEQLQALLDVADAVGGGLEFTAHRDGLLGADIGATPAIGAAPAEVLEDADLLADVEHQDFAGRAVVRASGASDALGGVEDGPAAEFLRGRARLRRIRQRHAPGLEADQRFLEFAQRT